MDEKNVRVTTFCKFNRFPGPLRRDLQFVSGLVFKHRLEIIEEPGIIETRCCSD